jgi:CBS domain-containing protein
MTVGELCNREVIVVNRDASVREAARLMRSLHVGDLVVVEERNDIRFPVGILTDRDLVVEIVAKEVDLDALSVGDVMAYELVTAKEEDETMETIERMRAKGIRRLPVVNEGGGLVGILTVDDLIDFLADQLNNVVKLISREQKREQETRA